MKRRQFLQGISGLTGAVALGACGSSSSTGSPSGSGEGNSSSPDAGSPPVTTPVTAPAGPPNDDASVSTALPAWLASAPVNAWYAIPGTVHAGSPAAPTDDPMDPYCFSNRRLSYSGMALRDTELVLAACGGHSDYDGNEVTSLDLQEDTPTWQLRSAATPAAQIVMDMAYYGDGHPSSRHTYWSHHWSTTKNRVMLHRSRFVWGSGISFDDSNGFDLAANAWDPAGTHAHGYDAACVDADDNVWAPSGYDLYKWTAATDTWEKRSTAATPYGYPICFDAKRGFLFAFCWGDGEADGMGVVASKITDDGTVQTPITFNPSMGLTQLQADAPYYAGMEYDPVHDQYLFYDGHAGNGRVYVITPNDGTVWDIDVLALAPGTATPPPVDVTCNRFRYVARLKGFVLMAVGSDNVYFLRTA
jgi:hypothetical protein